MARRPADAARHVEWPRSVSSEHPERGERPLHFVAQIACADLPAELWAARAARGWLLLFVDPNEGVPKGPIRSRSPRRYAGSERQPPADLGPVHDGMYTGPSYDYCRTIDDVPKLWRRWPVDLVAVPNTIAKEGNRTIVAPDNFAEILYGAPVAPERRRPSRSRALHLARRALRARQHRASSPNRSRSCGFRHARREANRPGYIASIIAASEADDAKWTATSLVWLKGPEPEDEAERERRARIRAVAEVRRTRREALSGSWQAIPRPDAIVDHLRQSNDQWRHWRAEVRERVAGERSAVPAHELDTTIPDDAWQALKGRLRQDAFRFWTYRWVERDGDSLHVSFEEIEVSAYAGRARRHQRVGRGLLRRSRASVPDPAFRAQGIRAALAKPR